MNKSQGFSDVKCWRCGKVARTSRLVDKRFMPKGWKLKEVLLLGFFLAFVKLCPKCSKEV